MTTPPQRQWISLGIVFGGFTPAPESFPDVLGQRTSPAPRHPSGGLLDEEAAREAMREAGFTPVGPFPAARSVPWESVCNGCGQTHWPTLRHIENGLTCKHR
jgi:hypothetical protein